MEREDLLQRPPAELADAITQLHGLATAALAKACEFIWAYDELGAWEDDGATSMTAWLVAALGVNERTASELARVARTLPDLPEISESFVSGGLSFDAVRPLTRFATPETDAHLADEARKFTASQLNRMARRARPLDPEEESEAYEKRSLKLRWDPERHRAYITAQLPDHQGAVVEKALDRVAEGAPPDPETGLREPYESVLADALVEICSTRIADDADPDRATVVVHVDAGMLAGGADGRAELDADGGRAISVETAMRLACDARWQLVADGPDGRALGIGRLSRTVPPWLTRLLRDRDAHCRFPGCTRRRWLYAHHVQYWADGGRTDLDNLCLLCFTHHRLVHEGGWTVSRTPEGELVFRRPDGSVLTEGPPPLRDELAERFFGDGDDAHATAGADAEDDPPAAARDGPV